MKKLNEEWRSKVKGIFESAASDTIFEMPQTDDEIVPEPLPGLAGLPMDGADELGDLGMGAGVAPIGGEEETITITKDALKELILAAKGEEKEDEDEDEDEIEDEEGIEDEVETDDIEDEEVSDIEEEDEIEDEMGTDDIEGEVADFTGEVEDEEGIEDIAGDDVEDSLDDEDDEVSQIVDKAFELAAGGVLGAEQIPEILSLMSGEEEEVEEPNFGVGGEEEEVEEPNFGVGGEEEEEGEEEVEEPIGNL